MRTSASRACRPPRSSVRRRARRPRRAELLADRRRPLEHRALARLEPVEPGGEQRLDRRRDRERPACPCPRRTSPRPPRRTAGCPRRPDDPLCGLAALGHSVGELREQRARRRPPPAARARSRLAAPARTLLEQVGPRHAEQEQRRVAAPVGDVLDEIEERRLGPVQVVDDERRAGGGAASASSSRATAQKVSSGATGSPAGMSSSAATRVDDQRPVRLGLDRCADQPVAAGQRSSASGHQVRCRRRRAGSGREHGGVRRRRSRQLRARAATCRRRQTPSTVNSWHERSATACSSRRGAAPTLAAAADHRRVEPPRRTARALGVDVEQAARLDRLALALRRTGSARSSLGGVAAHEPERRRARAGSRRRRAACSSRAATLTVSPVAKELAPCRRRSPPRPC